MNNGESIRFNYNGGVQTYIVPHNGVYKLEVWGGNGNGTFNYGGKVSGGYSKGYINLKKGTVLYICCGGGASLLQVDGFVSGGYNGGGDSAVYDPHNDAGYWTYHGAGGGATHIALVDGTLASIGQTIFNQKGLIVAGGGSGSGFIRRPTTDNTYYSGNTGGGTGGGNTFGQGASASAWRSGGAPAGGGGYIGGSQHAGGSGWIGGVTSYNGDSAVTSNGVNSGSGYAVITLVKKKAIKLGDIDCTVYLGSIEIDSIYHGGTEL